MKTSREHENRRAPESPHVMPVTAPQLSGDELNALLVGVRRRAETSGEVVDA
jgi:hypothetical protein